MMESAHTESLAIKDEKIKTLELHLEEKENLNATLHRQLDTMQKEYQSYLDKYVCPVWLLCVLKLTIYFHPKTESGGFEKILRSLIVKLYVVQFPCCLESLFRV